MEVLVSKLPATILCWLLPLASAAAPVTFHKDVAPILQARCQGCHHPGDIGPMSLISFREVRPWAKAIRTAVAQKKMPPWFADPSHGRFANDRTLSKSDVDTLIAWVDGGAVEGNPEDAPKPIQFSEDWIIGKPDLILALPKPFEIPASGVIPYQYVLIKTGFTEDKWVQAVEVRPSNRAVVHHINASHRDPAGDMDSIRRGEYSSKLTDLIGGPQTARTETDGEPAMFGNGDLLETFVPGGRPPAFKSGQARLIKAGSDLLFQIHYTTSGKPQQDRTRIGFIFAKEPPAEQIRGGLVFNQRFTIPPQASNQLVKASAQVMRDVKLFSLQPHMHVRGKDFEFRAIYPSGETEVLLSVPRYDFHWQTNYFLAEPKLLPKGTVIEVVGHFDNSPNNPNNPDPNAEVHYGPQTWDEMLNGFLNVIVEPGTGSQPALGPVAKTAATP
jgi:hypothetical protein